MLAVEVSRLKKTFRSGFWTRRLTVALDGVSFTVPRGMIFGILGPNGAGKTTLLSIASTLLLPDEGSIRLLGFDVVREARQVRERINLVSGHTNFIWSLSAREILDYHGMLYGLTGRGRKKTIDSLIDLFELRTHENVAYNELSTGLKQRLALAKGLINDPEILFLDEPTVALDPDISIRIREQISNLRRSRGMTVLLTTHDMPEAELLADEIAFLREGKILAQGDADSLKRQVKIGDTITMEVDGIEGRLDLTAVPGVLRYSAANGRIECVTDSARKRLPELLRLINEQGGVARDVRVVEPDLESVFVELVK